jgi:hypothetical protein
MPIQDDAMLHGFLARLLGWSDERRVELALSSVALAAVGCTTLVLCGKGYMVPIVQALHRRVGDPDRPFVVVDLRPGEQRASVRSPESRGSTVLALKAARRGTCCMRLRRAPADLAEMHRAAEDVMLVICGGLHLASDALSIRPAPVVVPLMASRVNELDRIIIEYAGDAIAELGAPHAAFTADDRAWVRDHAAGSLVEIEKATLRLVALRTAGNLSDAAARLGMAPVSLDKWLRRRRSPLMIQSGRRSH